MKMLFTGSGWTGGAGSQESGMLNRPMLSPRAGRFRNLTGNTKL